MVGPSALFDLGKKLGSLGQFGLQKGVSFEKLIALMLSQIVLSLKCIEASDFRLSFTHFLGTFLAELVMVSSQKRNLLEQYMILFCEKMDTFSVGFF